MKNSPILSNAAEIKDIEIHTGELFDVDPLEWKRGSRQYSEIVVRYCLKNKRAVAEKCIEPELIESFMSAETFIIDIDSWVNNDKTAHDIEATWADMLELKINKPPYKDFIVHCIVSATPASVFFKFEDDLETYQFFLIFPGLNESGAKKAHDNYSVVFKEGLTRGQGIASAVMMQLFVLLATENAEVVRKTGHTIINRRKNGSGGITYINAPHGGGNNDNGDEHGTCRPHLRRGHVRRQHYGAGNAFIKKIWVPPCFVNGTPEVPRDAYAERAIGI